MSDDDVGRRGSGTSDDDVDSDNVGVVVDSDADADIPHGGIDANQQSTLWKRNVNDPGQVNVVIDSDVNSDSNNLQSASQSKKFWPRKAFVNYWTSHFAFFVIVSMLGFFVLMGVEGLTPVNAWFTSVSAVSLTGLEVVGVNQFTGEGQFVVCLLSALGGWVLSTIPIVILRRRYMQKMTSDAHAEPPVEVRSLSILLWCLLFVVFASQTLVFISLWIYAAASNEVKTYLGAVGVSPGWFAFFHTVSAFSNSGISNLPLSLVPLRTHTFILFVLGSSILVGNTLFPICLRLLVWLWMRKAKTHQERAACEYLLDHGRECYTHLFDSYSTKIVLAANLSLLFYQTLLFCVSEGGNATLTDLSQWHFFTNALFTSVSTRSAGFWTVDIASLSNGTQVSMLSMMYVVAYPLLFVTRKTRTKGAKKDAQPVQIDQRTSLGPLIPDEESSQDHNAQSGGRRCCNLPPWLTIAYVRRMFTGAWSHNVALRDVSIMYLCVLVISYSQGHEFPRHSAFVVVFEVVSAYGAVGFSLLPPGLNYSAVTNNFTKMVVTGIMLLSRVRSLVSSNDPAVNPPSTLDLQSQKQPHISAEAEGDVRFTS